jgi:DNA mismatch repair ATPase MutS
MTIAEKIQISADKKCFTFFREGLFYKYYNEDAMVFVKKVREYKVNNKFVKSTRSNVLSIGFPVSDVEKGKQSPKD